MPAGVVKARGGVQGKRIALDTALAAIDTVARETAVAARDAGVPAVRGTMPARSGRLKRGIVGRIGRTPDGYSLTIGPTTKVRYPGGRGTRSATGGVSAAEVFRFVDRGTGIYGRSGRPIRPKRADAFRLPNGVSVEEVRGQRPQALVRQGQTAADPAVLRTLEQGADDAARAAEEAL